MFIEVILPVEQAVPMNIMEIMLVMDYIFMEMEVLELFLLAYFYNIHVLLEILGYTIDGVAHIQYKVYQQL